MSGNFRANEILLGQRSDDDGSASQWRTSSAGTPHRALTAE